MGDIVVFAGSAEFSQRLLEVGDIVVLAGNGEFS